MLLVLSARNVIIKSYLPSYCDTKKSMFLRHLFEQLDLKQDGKIDADELAIGLQNMGYSNITKVKFNF